MSLQKRGDFLEESPRFCLALSPACRLQVNDLLFPAGIGTEPVCLRLESTLIRGDEAVLGAIGGDVETADLARVADPGDLGDLHPVDYRRVRGVEERVGVGAQVEQKAVLTTVGGLVVAD